MRYFSRDETEIGGGCSRDETEMCEFGDDRISQREFEQAVPFGGWFNSLLSASGMKKAVEKKASKQAGQKVTFNVRNPTTGELASSVGKAAVMFAPIAASAGAGALVAPALLAAAPIVKNVATTAAPIVKAGGQLNAAVKGSISLPTAESLVSLAGQGKASAKQQIEGIKSLAAKGDVKAQASLAAIQTAQRKLGVQVASGVSPALAASVEARARAAGVSPLLVAAADARAAAEKAAAQKVGALDPKLAAALAAVRTAAEADSVWALAVKGRPGSAQVVATIRAAAAKGDPKAKLAAGLLAAAEARRNAAGLKAALAARAIAPAATLSLVRPVAPVAVVRPPPVSALTASIAAPAAAAAALAALAAGQPKATDPKYLVLDSGQVLAGAQAREKRAGFVVRFNGSVARQ